MKYYIIAGEASGDLHASNLMRELKQLDAEAQFRCWGGDRMAGQGGDIVKHYKDLAFMGFLEVLMNLRTILKNIAFCKADILAWRPDVVIMVDYPGFNLRIAAFLKQHGIRSFYYISPQVWAWKESRVKKIKEQVDRMFVILPFEKAFYEKWQYQVDFVGHPLLDAIQEYPADKLSFSNSQPIIALLPGSRKQEIAKMLPIMAAMPRHFPEYQFVIAGLSHIGEAFYRNYAPQEITLVMDSTYPLLLTAHAALVTSGTATLETALFNVPQVVCYKGSWFSYIIGKQLVKVKYISLVNLILDKAAVKELIQYELNEQNLRDALNQILQAAIREDMQATFKELRNKLGGSGASKRAASLMWQYLHE
ncbi:MAG: lipid-A-disaccharide synthase [Chitinophagales bacterium]|nr:lipid-A-disaccharide synthase [Chitinophagales bacterium]